MRRRQQYILAMIDFFGFWSNRCGDIFGTYYVLDLLFPRLKHYGDYPIEGDVALKLALTLWMVTWLIWILEMGLKKHFKKLS